VNLVIKPRYLFQRLGEAPTRARHAPAAGRRSARSRSHSAAPGLRS
jgi:hypothetical protein